MANSPNGNRTVETDRWLSSDAPQASGSLWGIPLWLSAGVFFVLSLGFGQLVIPFYRHDNAVYCAPLIIDAARQVLEGNWPGHTFYVGGGGGMPVVATLQAGVLNPLTLLPAMILKDSPRTMMNVIVALHFAVAAAGCGFMATVMRAPRWVALVAAFSFAMNGYLWIYGGAWFSQTVPYAFMPWLIGGILLMAYAEDRNEVRAGRIVTGAATVLLFYSGAPNPAFYTGVAVFFVLAALVASSPRRALLLGMRAWPVLIVSGLLVIPLLWGAYQVHGFFARKLWPYDFWVRSVPLQGYLGLFLPQSYSLWHLIGDPGGSLLTNMLVFAGGLPAWYVMTRVVRDPKVLMRTAAAPLFAGIVIFVLLMSPHTFGLAWAFPVIPVLNMFRSSIRAIPAFQMLLTVLFVYLATEAKHKVKPYVQVCAVAGCLVAGVLTVAGEVVLFSANKPLGSWFTVNPWLDDAESWSDAALAHLRKNGFVLSVVQYERSHDKPRLFFCGNLGAEERVKTVGCYHHTNSEAFAEAGINFKGRVEFWEKGKKFLEMSRSTPVEGAVRWNNGIAPESLSELVEKTFIGAAVVDKTWEAPLRYFKESPQWRILEERPSAVLFVRK